MDLSLEELQAQFKQIQQEGATHRLSERNCVELIMKLINLNMIHVIFSSNGREYITPKQLEVEIQDEILQHRGRINVVELQPLLNVDMAHIEKKVNDLVKKDRRLQLVEGELISNYYLDNIAEEINESLQEVGELTFSDLAVRFGLSADFLERVIEQRLGSVIHGKMEGSTLYTNAFVERQSSLIRGIFSAITQPTVVGPLISQFKLHDRLFYSVVEELIQNGQVNGTLQGHSERAFYIPTVFSQARQLWVDSFYQNNNFIEYSALERLQYNKPRQILEQRFPDGLALHRVYVSPAVISQLDGVANDTIVNASWVDCSPFVPSTLDDKDILALLEKTPSIIQQGKSKNAVVLEGHYVVSIAFLERCLKLYDQSMREKAEKGMLEPPPQKDKDEEETPQESKGKKANRTVTKKAPVKSEKKPQQGQSKLEENMVEFKKWFEDAPEDLLEAIIKYLATSLQNIREEASRAVFKVDASQLKKQNESFQEQANTLYNNIQIFQKAIETLPEEETNLEKHLLKTLCSQLVNKIILNQAQHFMITVKETDSSVDQAAIISQLPKPIAEPLTKLTKTLTGKSIKDFFSQLDLVGDSSQLRLKPLDKKLEKQLLITHRQTMMDQLINETNPATCFHLVVVLLYLKKFNVVVHVPGKTIATLVSKLKEVITPEIYSQLTNFQASVIQYLTNKNPSLEQELQENTPKLKEIVLGKDK